MSSVYPSRRRLPDFWQSVFIATILAITLLVVVMAKTTTTTVPTMPVAPVVRALYPDQPGGTTWHDGWWTKDEWDDDPWVRSGAPDDSSYRSKDGILYVSGETSRFYVFDPQQKHQWGNVEITVYAKRVRDDGVFYSGIVTSARTNHGMSDTIENAPCDSRGVSARLRFDGSADFGKETNHPTTIATPEVEVFPGGMPHDQWIGYKHVVYDIDGGTGTHQELWMDLTNGKDGGDWRLVESHDDHYGDDFGEVACAKGIDPTWPMTMGPRPGSESGKPNLSILLRADGIGKDGLQYRDFSIREILPPTTPTEVASGSASPAGPPASPLP